MDKGMVILKRYGLLGFPLGHTMSPPIHKKFFELDGISGCDYGICEIPPEELSDRIDEVKALGGFNVTIPHKAAIIPYLDGLGESAQRYGAVNCVAVREGKYIGYNTDCDGFLRSLEAAGASLEGRVLLCGCGGAGRMIAIEAIRHGAELTVLVREGRECTVEPVLEYAEKNGIDAKISVVTAQTVEGRFDLLVNATPLGMYPKVDGCPVSEEIIAGCGFVFDVVYNPERTRLIELAQKHGVKTCGGMAMLVWQAAVAHEIWNGARYSDRDIEKIIGEMHEMMRSFS